jgi:hypothetical protein
MIITEARLSANRRFYGQNELDYQFVPAGYSWVEDYFDYLHGASRPGVSLGEILNVAIVFAFWKKIPVLPADRTWIGLQHQVGGHACNNPSFIATEIFVRPNLYGALRQIARDRWPGGRAGWDGAHYSWGSIPKEAIARYRSELAGMGLSYSGDRLCEGIYPFDATQQNLDVVAEAPLSLASLGVNDNEMANRVEASFLILAPNSD